MGLFVYICKCGKPTEKIQPKHLSVVKCDHCSGLAKYTVSGHAKTPGAWIV